MKLNPLLPLAACSLLCLALPSPAQTPKEGGDPTPTEAPEEDNEEAGPPPFWQTRMNGGHFMVALRSVSAIAKHEYISDGAARVIEVTIATNSSVAARFYYLEPISSKMPLPIGQKSLEVLEEKVRSVAGRTGSEELLDAVVKNYPTTTHAHTVEFRLQEESDISSLYKSIHSALESGKGRIWNDPARNR